MAWFRDRIRAVVLVSSIALIAAVSTPYGYETQEGAYAPLERPKTLLLDQPSPLLLELHRQSVGLSFLSSTWPQVCGGSPLWGPACPPRGHLTWSEGTDFLSVRWIGGAELRLLEDDRVESFDLGAQIGGRLGAMNFALDARVFSEFHDLENPSSWDGEYVERQKEGKDAHFSFLSYSRYRGNLLFDFSWGRLGWRREAPHWGPSYHHALLFNRNAIPFDHLVYEGALGPLKVTSFMGNLVVDGWGRWTSDPDLRTVYAHRYELQLHPSLLMGVSEQLILFEDRTWMGMVPVIPLFMLKSQLAEHNNNGNLSFDLQWRALHGVRLYGEFLIDDLSEPTSLFNDFWKNKWAVTLGAHLARELGAVSVGTLGEWTRIEPWVYTHYVANTAQAVHHGVPLGDPLGPDAMAITWRNYLKHGNVLYSITSDWNWKGIEEGSSLEDTRDSKDRSRKEFLRGIDASEWSVSPEVIWSGEMVGVLARVKWGRSTQEALLRFSVGF